MEPAGTPSKSPKARVLSKLRVINQVANKSDTYPPTWLTAVGRKQPKVAATAIQKRTNSFTLQTLKTRILPPAPSWCGSPDKNAYTPPVLPPWKYCG